MPVFIILIWVAASGKFSQISADMKKKILMGSAGFMIVCGLLLLHIRHNGVILISSSLPKSNGANIPVSTNEPSKISIWRLDCFWCYLYHGIEQINQLSVQITCVLKQFCIDSHIAGCCWPCVAHNSTHGSIYCCVESLGTDSGGCHNSDKSNHFQQSWDIDQWCSDCGVAPTRSPHGSNSSKAIR